MLTTDGQVVYVIKTPVFVVVPVVVSIVVPVLVSGKSVKVSPSVVTTAVIVKLVGTVIKLVPQIKRPEEEVTTTPSGRVSANTEAVLVGIGNPVGWNVNVSPTIVAVTGAVKPVGTVNVFVPHSKSPEEKVTTTPSGKG